MPITIPVAHDFICPWCYVALLQINRLKEEFDVEFEWVGYELFPEDMEWPAPRPAEASPANKPPVLSRFEFLLYADGVSMPDVERPNRMKSYNAHQAVEYAKTEGVANELTEKLYRALWEEGQEINLLEVILEIAQGTVRNLEALKQAIQTKQFSDKIIPYDQPAYDSGVYNVPTYFIAGERYAEQPLGILRNAIIRATSA